MRQRRIAGKYAQQQMFGLDVLAAQLVYPISREKYDLAGGLRVFFEHTASIHFTPLMSGRALHQPGSGEANQAAGNGQRGYLFMQARDSERQRHHWDQKRGARSAGRAKLASRRSHQNIRDGRSECAECRADSRAGPATSAP